MVLLSGQVLGGLLIAHFGLLGSTVERLNGVRLLGAAIMIAGAILAVMGRIPLGR